MPQPFPIRRFGRRRGDALVRGLGQQGGAAVELALQAPQDVQRGHDIQGFRGPLETHDTRDELLGLRWEHQAKGSAA